MDATSANKTEKPWYCFKFLDTFRAAAPGRISREFKISRPTQEMANVTMTAIKTVNTVWVSPVGMPLEEASWGWMAVKVKRLL